MTEQEAVCLSICALGEDLLAIGSWEEPVRALAARGLLVRVGNGYRITPAGQAEYVAFEENAESRGLPDERTKRGLPDIEGEVTWRDR